MRNRYLVVDQNYLRSEDIKRIVATQSDVCFVLPDLAMLEMTKSVCRELTVRLSLETIAKCPNRVFIAKALGESLKYELTNKRPVVGHLVFREATQFIRRLLSAIAANSSNANLARVLDDPKNHIADLERDYLDHPSNRSSALELVAATKKNMSAAFAKRVRGAKATSDELLAFVALTAPSLLVDVLEDNGFSRQKAIAFARRKPMLLRYFYLKVWACLDWEKMGWLESVSAAKVSNELLDHEYVLAATFFDGVLSNEASVNDGYRAVTQILSGRVYPSIKQTCL